MAPTFPFTDLDPVEVFAVDDRSAQLTWRGLPDGVLGAVIDGDLHELGEAGRPGAADVPGLPADRHLAIDVTVDGRVVHQRTVRTRRSLGESPLTRIATINDVHLGEDGFGLLKDLHETEPHADGYPMRCARSAVRQAVDWGAELLVIKGDITDLGRPEEWDLVDELFADIPLPILAIPGNHDTVAKPTSVDPVIQLRKRGLFPAPVHHIDLPGVRVVAADTNVVGHSWGRLRRHLDALLEAVDVDTPVMLMLHHHLEAWPVPVFWPLGVNRREANHVLDALLEVNPDLFVSSGHTHRNRMRRHGSAMITEIGSPKDYPGVWAGYEVYAGAIRQTVRRIDDPSCVLWNDRTHAAVGGIWGRWSIGRLDDRCVDQSVAAVAASAPAESGVARLDA